MATSKSWNQEGPLGSDGNWAVDFDHEGRFVQVSAVNANHYGPDSADVKPVERQQLRDFARALDRAAASLDAVVAEGGDEKP